MGFTVGAIAGPRMNDVEILDLLFHKNHKVVCFISDRTFFESLLVKTQPKLNKKIYFMLLIGVGL